MTYNTKQKNQKNYFTCQRYISNGYIYLKRTAHMEYKLSHDGNDDQKLSCDNIYRFKCNNARACAYIY